MSTDNNQNSVNRYERYSEHTAQFTSSITVNLQQLQTHLAEQHRHEKGTLVRLNESLGLLLRRVQSLQKENSKYLEQIVGLCRQSSGVSYSDTNLSEQYTHLYSDFSSISGANIDSEFNYELFRLQTEIYQKLIDIEQQSKDDQHSKLEQELKQLTSNLGKIKATHTEKQQEIEMLNSQRRKLVDQYLGLTYDYYNAKKQRKKWDLNGVALKNHIEFYKNIRTYTQQNFGAAVVYTGENLRFSSVDFNDIVKRIRRDFELLYSKVYNAMTAYYDVKMREIESGVGEIVHYQELELSQQKKTQQTLQIEYDEVHKSLLIEQETSKRFEAMLAKLTAEFDSLQQKNEERFDMQAVEYQNIQESIATVSLNATEIRQSMFDLETELVIYRHLLSDVDSKEQVTVVTNPTTAEASERFFVENKKKRKGSIGIKTCAPNGTYIIIKNYSTSKDFDISKYMIKRRIDSAPDLFYTLPENIQIQRGGEVIIYSKRHGDGVPMNNSSIPYQEIVNNDLVSWGIGNTIETILFNRNGDEEASYLQALVFRNEQAY